MIMGRLTTTWRCILLMIFFLYVHPQVDSAHSDQTPSNASSPNSTELSHQKECSALLQLKNTTYEIDRQCLPCNDSDLTSDEPCSKTDSWMEGKDCCSWDGVLCDVRRGSNVVGLDLYSSCLKGPLNLSIFLQLPHLETLVFARNSLTGSIPEPPSKLETLSKLDLSTNMLSGKIPDIFSKLRGLQFLDLSGNNFSGPIPHSLCDELPNLSSLSLSYNSLTGRVPSCLFNIPSLYQIDLANNQLTGLTGQFKPTTARDLTLSLRNNKINGPIPSSIFELVNLASLDLSSNNLTGTFKFDKLLKLRDLWTLNLSGNSLLSFSFDGKVNLSSLFLQDLTLSSCNISDLVPLLPPPFLQEDDDFANKFSWKIAMMGYGCGMVIGLSIGYFVLSTGKVQWLDRIINGRFHKKVRRPF